jgi:hypothetical protein
VSDLEMTCNGAGGEWWPIFEHMSLEDEVRRNLREVALDELGSFGYGAEWPGPGCERHPTEVEGCTDCFDEYHRQYVERAEKWAKEEAESLAPELERSGYVETRLGDQRIWFRTREAQ